MRLKRLLLPILLVFSTFIFAQVSEYNLPPGYHLNPSTQILDLSYKLKGNVLEKEIPNSQLVFLKDLSKIDLKETSLEYQMYIKDGENFINSLSKYVRDIYNDQELWYIYAFDGDLKRLIQNLN